MTDPPAHDPEQERLEETDRERRRRSPRIYVASLADYNAGRLHGVWLDAARSEAEVLADISTMLDRSTSPGAEEWAIHDFEGFGITSIGEYEPLAHVVAIAAGVVEYGEAFSAWASRRDTGEGVDARRFEEQYRGTWPSRDGYAADLLDDLGAEAELERLPSWLQPYVEIRIEAFANDMQLSGEIDFVDGNEGVHVFGIE